MNKIMKACPSELSNLKHKNNTKKKGSKTTTSENMARHTVMQLKTRELARG